MIDQGEVLKRCRKFRGWTQAKLADRAGVSLMTVHRIEHGSGANFSTYETLLKSLGFQLEITIDRKWRG